LLSASAQQRAELQKADVVEDAIVLAAISVVLLVVTIAAALIPARHAA